MADNTLIAIILDKYSIMLKAAIVELEEELPDNMKREETVPFSNKPAIRIDETVPLWEILEIIEYDIDLLREANQVGLNASNS